jgi:hypothetical protein
LISADRSRILRVARGTVSCAVGCAVSSGTVSSAIGCGVSSAIGCGVSSAVGCGVSSAVGCRIRTVGSCTIGPALAVGIELVISGTAGANLNTSAGGTSSRAVLAHIKHIIPVCSV